MLWAAVSAALLSDERPGPVGKGVTLLPNGWRIAPAGRHVMVGDLPLSMLVSPDGRWAIVTNNGYAKPTLSIVDLRSLSMPDKTPIPDAWLGLAWHPDGTRLYASGGADGTVREYLWKPGKLTLARTFAVGTAIKEGFLGGVAIRPDGSRLYVVDVLGKRLSALDLGSGEVTKRVDLPAEPYGCLISADGAKLYVSLWGGARVLVFDAGTLESRGEFPVGEHPNAMSLSADGNRLFVACANTNSAWVIDLASRAATEQISVALSLDAPPGSTPNALALSPDGRTLLVANADNNLVAVVDVSRPSASHVAGFIPTGWYPTGVAFTPDGKRILVLSGKGLTSMPNPRGPQPGAEGDPSQYVGAMLTGALSILETPGPAALEKYTETVHRVTPGGAPRPTSPRAPRSRRPFREARAAARRSATFFT